jgi:hypothetical protein
MKGVLGVAFVISVGICIGVGCAKSEEEDPLIGIANNDPADGGKKKDSDGNASKKVTKKDDASDDDDDNASSSSSSSSSGSTSSSSSGGSTSSSSSSSGGSSSGGADPCKTTTCSLAKNLGSVSGDKSSAAKTVTGAASQWFTLDVTEDDSNWITGVDLSLRATLTSPAGKNFDLFVYVPDDGGIKECHAGEESSENETGDDKVTVSWGEGGSPNGYNDTRTVSVEVREIVDPAAPPATCDPTATWSLKLEGHK